MPEVTGRQSSAERAFLVALSDLHLRAGEPSSRELARSIGGISHTTVNLALRGTKVPSWPVVVKLVEHLGGDVEVFRQLWVDVREPSHSHRDQTKPDISVFVSYARIDDQATYLRISQLVDDIANTYRSMTGQEVAVFQDIDSIKLGDEWKDRIRLGLSSSTIMLAFISPAYLGSTSCREELSEFLAFLDAAASARLIIQLLYADEGRIEARFANDALWERLKTIQKVDISKLRSTDPGTSQWITKVEEVTQRIDEVLAEAETFSPTLTTQAAVSDFEEEIPEGILERMAATEKAMPEINETIVRLGALLEEVGTRTEAAAPRMQKADTFGKKLIVSRELAADLAPIADEITERVAQVITGFNSLDDFVTNILTFSKSATAEVIKNPDTVVGLNAIWQLATVAAASIGQLDQFNKTLAQVIGFSKDLDRPLRSMRGAFLRMADIRGILNVWLSELRTLESTHPDILSFDS